MNIKKKYLYELIEAGFKGGQAYTIAANRFANRLRNAGYLASFAEVREIIENNVRVRYARKEE